jgi:hypothetical protein
MKGSAVNALNMLDSRIQSASAVNLLGTPGHTCVTPSGVIVKYSPPISWGCATTRSYGLYLRPRTAAGTRKMQRSPCLLWPAVPKKSTQSSAVRRPRLPSIVEEEEEGSEAARDREGLAELPGDSMRGKRLAGGDMCDERIRTPIFGGCHGPLAVFVSCARRRKRGTSASISLRGSR